MGSTLYHYVHCPFCVRVRMAAGYLGVAYESKVVPYDDEQTPTKLIGKKMLPVWVDSNGKAQPESLDIIKLLDQDNKLGSQTLLQSEDWKKLECFLNEAGNSIHSLAMPYFIYTKEFDENSRKYFQKKKEEKRGPFKELVKNRPQLEEQLKLKLNQLEYDLRPFYLSDRLTVLDICLASHLWGLYVVPEFQFPPQLHHYLQRVKKQCNFNYHEDYWK